VGEKPIANRTHENEDAIAEQPMKPLRHILDKPIDDGSCQYQCYRGYADAHLCQMASDQSREKINRFMHGTSEKSFLSDYDSCLAFYKWTLIA
jgi:hypothetical protein